MKQEGRCIVICRNGVGGETRQVHRHGVYVWYSGILLAERLLISAGIREKMRINQLPPTVIKNKLPFHFIASYLQ